MTPLLQQVISLVGRRADDPALVDFVTNTLGKKIPPTMSANGQCKYVVAKKQGIEMAFVQDIKNEKYPLIHKTKIVFIPYLTVVWLKENFPEPLPFGLTFSMSPEEITGKLGTPYERGFGKYKGMVWRRSLDPARDISLEFDPKTCSLVVDHDLTLSERFGSSPAEPMECVFVAWAIQRNLLDESRFPDHADLLQAVRKRKQLGSAFVAAALPRGLWDTHLKDAPGLRQHAFQWFHNIGGMFISSDLIAVFGSRENKFAHDEPILDSDDWENVDKATPILDKRFAEWITLSRKKR